jgi:hypothetical protein
VLYLVRWLRTFQGHIRACSTSPPASAAVGASTACACSHEVRLCCAGGQGRAPRRLPVPASAVLRTRQLCVCARACARVCACACVRYAGEREGAQDRARARVLCGVAFGEVRHAASAIDIHACGYYSFTRTFGITDARQVGWRTISNVGSCSFVPLLAVCRLLRNPVSWGQSGAMLLQTRDVG